MSAALNLVTPVQTAAEILEENSRRMATTKLVAKRFPDAVFQGGEWRSLSVKASNAKGAHVEILSGGLPERAILVHPYVTLCPKGCEPVRVYSKDTYHLNKGHVEALLQGNAKQVLAKVAECWKED